MDKPDPLSGRRLRWLALVLFAGEDPVAFAPRVVSTMAATATGGLVGTTAAGRRGPRSGPPC